VDRAVRSKHLKNIYEEQELEGVSTSVKIAMADILAQTILQNYLKEFAQLEQVKEKILS
jgi:hypothetical protein